METQASHINAEAGGVSDQDRTASQRKHFGHPPPVCWTGSGKGLGVLLRAERDSLPSENIRKLTGETAVHTICQQRAQEVTGRLRTQGRPHVPLLSACLSSAQSCLTLRDPVDCSTPDLHVHHQLPELTRTHVLPTISSSVVPFSSCLQSVPASGSFPMSQFFTSGGQSIGVSASVSALPINIQD